MTSSFASLRLVLHTTTVAAGALRALATMNVVFPGGHVVVNEALRSISIALRQVGSKLPYSQPALLPSRGSESFEEVLAELIDDEPRSRDPALVEQEITGCKTLLLEVIRRAAYDWVLYRTSRRLQHKRLAEDAYTWLFEEKPGHVNWVERDRVGKHITSFLSICSELDLDAATVRKYVRKLTVKNVMSVGRPAEYRRRETCPSSMGEEHVPVLRNGSWAEVEASFDATGTDDY
jgi:hypothetical protein